MFKNEYFAADYDGIQWSSVYNYIIKFAVCNIYRCMVYTDIYQRIRIYEYIPTYTYVYIQIPFYPS